ncbi:MAG: galactokinase [Saprospiraceae bacterium]|nr:galactokinase [Saprospiraceae bacterium]
MEMNIKDALVNYHRQLFNPESIIIASPGRVNIIGEHTDYNNGLVLPYALDKHIYMSASLGDGQSLKVYSADQKRYVDFRDDQGMPSWSRYYIQAINYIEDNYGPCPPLEITMLSDLPIGAGISSSSALTCGVIYLIDHFMKLELTPDEMIKIATYTEHGIGLQGGAMDQSTILKARKDHAALMDFGLNTIEYIPLEMGGYDWWMVYTDVEHSLVDSEYNTRRKECETSVSLISEQFKEIEHLSQLIPSDLATIRLDDPLDRRTKFVVEENQRVRAVVDMLKHKEISSIGPLLNASHLGLSKEYEVSTNEVDWLIEQLQKCVAVCGARMIGGGFGGSILVLIEKDKEDEIHQVVDSYNRIYGKEAFAFNAHSGNALIEV